MRRKTAYRHGHLPSSWQAEHSRQVLRHEAKTVRTFAAIILVTVLTWVIVLALVVFHL